MIQFLARIDGAVQGRFDSVCFFLMRRFGIRKSLIRYALYAVMTIAIGASVVAESALGIADGTDWFFGGSLILLLLLVQFVERRDDLDAERAPGTMSRADSRGSMRMMKLFSLFSLGYHCLRLKYPTAEYVEAGLTNGEHVFPYACHLTYWIGWLLMCYLMKTPMNPPAAKEKEPILTPRPAPAKL